ncbi:hypothetical protein [Treponema sp. J25]|uniref:hypothetical protein n=1 Tax=Treponema sp. J25 TaxID=2094121 RepID=UPI0010500660|nr:hypothetical protein [Treponema sp. J25]TCW60996.1 hypothetical protein C5O22_08645 [Treponema sp. J25]
MKRHTKIRLISEAILWAWALVVFSCASAPASSQSQVAPPPAWTIETPAPRDGYTFFVGYADGPVNGEVQATEAATASLVAEIMRYIGVTVTAESTATARSTLDSFQAELVQTVKQSSTSRMSGFQVAERYVLKKPNGVTVYILGRYLTKDLEAEKRRIQAVFQEKIDAVAVPEREGQELLAAGDVIGAVRKFITAAVAASGANIDNAAIKLERNLNNAREALARLEVRKLNDRLETSSGGTFAEPFKAQVLVSGKPLAGVTVLVSYQGRQPNGRMVTRTQKLLSNERGEVLFDHPRPDFVGKAQLTMRLDLSAEMEALYGIPDKYQNLVASLEDAIAAKRVTFEYTVISRAKTVPTAVLIVDINQDGKGEIKSTNSALLQSLTGNGFRLSVAPLSAEQIMGSDDTAILSLARKTLTGKADRFIYGTTRIAGIRADGTQKIATVSAEVKVVELSTGALLYSTVKQASTVAGNDEAAVEAARRQLGQKLIGEDLMGSLP